MSLGLYSGMRIVESMLALEKTKRPVREHKRRRWMSERYHARIQKKWLKRFGTVMKPCMYVLSPRAVGMPGADYIVCHPALLAPLRKAYAERYA